MKFNLNPLILFIIIKFPKVEGFFNTEGCSFYLKSKTRDTGLMKVLGGRPPLHPDKV